MFPFLNLGLSYINKDSSNTITVALNCEDSYIKSIFNDFSVNSTEQKLSITKTDNPIESLESGIIDCFIEANDNEIQFVFNPYSYNSIACATKLGENFEKFYHRNSDNIETYAFTLKDYNGNKANISASVSNIIIPILLLSILLKSASGFAADLFAGERERKTLELLLLCGVSKHKIYLGKLGSLLVLSISSALLSFLGWILSYKDSFVMFAFMQRGNSNLNIFALTSTLLSLSVLFTIIYTTTSLFARSVRNTHFLNDVLSFIPIGIAIMVAIAPIQSRNILLYFVPILNLTVCFCNAFIGKTDFSYLFIALTSNAIFMFMLMFMGIKYMHTERFIK